MFGAPTTVQEQLVEGEQKKQFVVLRENWDALVMFLRLHTQWVIGGMGVYVGLNYQSVEFLFRIYGVKDEKQMLQDLHVMEMAALKEFARQAEEKN